MINPCPSTNADSSALSVKAVRALAGILAVQLLVLPLLAIAGESSAHQSAEVDGRSQSLSDYSYDPARGPRGKVLHYLKSNLDGSNRAVVSAYFVEPLKLEVLKVERDGAALALVQAELDPATLTESAMRSFNALETGKPRQQMVLRSEQASRRLVAHAAGTDLPVTVAHLPAHLYNFDFMGLNATLPHLSNLRRDFSVGVVDPDFEFLAKHFKPASGSQVGGLVYKGLAHFRFKGEEALDAVPCLRYEVSGPAFRDIKGTLWINARDGLIERFEHSVPDNPAWTNLRLARISDRAMPAADWEAFKAATILRARALAGSPP